MNGLKIPFTGIPKQYNNLRTEILDATDTVLRSGSLMSGEYTEQFESWLAKKNHSLYAITCHSGTQALEIIASYLHDLDDAIVSVPAMTYVD
jgi:dTDP-4-amino-4,6-dideoxygalactose transaminase